MIDSQLLFSLIGRLRLTGFVEGVSYLILLFIAMPLKYIWAQPEVVRVTGLVHGILFILFIYYIVQAAIEKRWTRREVALAVLSSIVPFGTFYADRRLFKLYQ